MRWRDWPLHLGGARDRHRRLSPDQTASPPTWPVQAEDGRLLRRGHGKPGRDRPVRFPLGFPSSPLNQEGREATFRDRLPQTKQGDPQGCLPHIEDTLDSLRGSAWFSSLDIRWGYWNIPMAKSAAEKTAFCVPGHGLYQFKRMPFGLCNVPATFQRLMDRLLPRHLSRVYLDDIVVPGRTFAEALSGLREVFLALRSANFLLNPEKCRLFQNQLPYLGRIIDKNGVRADLSKVAQVQSWPAPQDKENLRSFLGLAQYYAKFIKDFAEIAAPLHRLTEKHRPFEWGTPEQHSFARLRDALVSPPVLAYPDPDGGIFTLDCDASQFALGMVLSQEQDGNERVIAYGSKSLSKPQRNYCVTRKELLAIVEGVKHFHHYLSGRPFRVRTDHAALKWLLSLRHTAEGQLARWLELLSAYDFSIEHRPGRLHGNADALSRRPCERECSHCSHRDQPGAATNRLRLTAAATPSPADLRAAQSTDLDIAPLLSGAQSQNRPSASSISDRSERTKALWLQWDSLEMAGGLLCRRVVDPLGDVLQVVVPNALIPTVLQLFHDDGGHLGGYKTYSKIRQHFYWPGMRQDTKLYCMSCEPCCRRKGPPRRTRAPLGIHNVGVPWERVGVDLAGPFPKTERGNKYLLVVVDYFTRWPEAIPIPSMHSHVAARALVEHIFSRFGAPCELHSDQGRTFESTLFREVLRLMGVRKTRTTPLHPQSDGAVERLIKTLEVQLSLFIDTRQSDWDLQVPLALMGLRGAPHSSTGHSPAMMLFGRELSLPSAVVRGVPPQTPALPARLRYPIWLRDRLQRLHHAARKRVNAVTLRRKERYDVRARHPHFRAGDAVWLYDPRRRAKRNPKLQAPWTGPYLITRMLSDVVAQLRLRGDHSPRAKIRTVHVNRLARCVLRRRRG